MDPVHSFGLEPTVKTFTGWPPPCGSARNEARNRSVLMRRMLGILVVVLSLLLAMPPAASAQSIFATLSGTVRDASGAVVPGADVTVRNVSSHQPYKTVTNREGFFTLTTLPASAYDVSATVKGFATWVAKGIVLNSSDSRAINIDLKMATTTEQVEVTSTTQEVATVDSGEKSAVISSKELQNLALVSRNATEFVKLLPGATLGANGGVNRAVLNAETIGINGF